MLTFDRVSKAGHDRVSFQPCRLIVAGWTGRDQDRVQHHIRELAAIGVPGPGSIPLFYRVSASNLTQDTTMTVLGRTSSGEVEPVIVSMDDGLWLGVGSDHTDREAETVGIALSKQLCGKPVGRSLWRLDEVEPHYDALIIRAHATIDGTRTLYQEGRLAELRLPRDLLDLLEAGQSAPGMVMYGGTVSAIGGIRPAARFEMELHDPVLGRSLHHAYDVAYLPVIT